MRQPIYFIVIASLVLSSITPVRLYAAPIKPPVPITADSLTIPSDYVAYIAAPDFQPLLHDIPLELPTLYDIAAELVAPTGPYRTTVNIRGGADLARLKKIGTTVLSSTKTTATVIADRPLLEQLAKASFFPRNTELTDRLLSKGGTKLPRTATAADTLGATASDSDGDGLNDTEEGWWCTDPNNADSDNDKVKDGDEVQGLIDWVQHKRPTRPSTTPPFSGWPPDHVGCYDRDYDSVPDAVEVYVFGLDSIRKLRVGRHLPEHERRGELNER